ncbi:MAG: ATPase domain-containing protein [Acidobacteriota bacterium]
MSHRDPKLGKMATGIPGLDHLLCGGLVRGNSLLVEGPPGSGKSTLAIRILYEGILQFNEPGLLISFEEFPRQIYQEALGHGVDLRSLEQSGRLRVVWTSPARVAEGFHGKNDLIEKIIEEIGVQRLVIDSVTHFKRISPSEVEMRELLAKVLNTLKLKTINAILVKELERIDPGIVAFEEYLVDASVRVHNVFSASGGENERFLEIRKTRGQAHISGKHPFRLGASGIKVFPHFRPAEVRRIFQPSAQTRDKRVPSGVPGLDLMLAGGLWQGTANLIVGYPGTGKTVLAQHFVDDGLRASQPCLMVSLGKPAAQLKAQAESLGLSWSSPRHAEILKILTFDPVNLCFEELLDELHTAIKDHFPSRLVFDSLDALWSPSTRPDLVRDQVRVLTSLVEAAGITSLLLHQTNQMGGISVGEALDCTHLASCVIQLSMAEVGGELLRFVGVLKHSGSDHAKELREFEIGEFGFQVKRKATGLSGILTGQTQGALQQTADEVLPSLDQVTDSLRRLIEQAGTPESVRAELKKARSNLGLIDVLLREHFGLTEFQKLAEELSAKTSGSGSPG